MQASGRTVFAGMRTDACSDPWTTHTLAEAIEAALTMPDQVRVLFVRGLLSEAGGWCRRTVSGRAWTPDANGRGRLGSSAARPVRRIAGPLGAAGLAHVVSDRAPGRSTRVQFGRDFGRSVSAVVQAVH
jgi:hypothetical protein